MPPATPMKNGSFLQGAGHAVGTGGQRQHLGQAPLLRTPPAARPPTAAAHLWPRIPRCGLPPLSPSCVHVWLSSRESRSPLGLLPVLTMSRERSPLPDLEFPGCCWCQSNDMVRRGRSQAEHRNATLLGEGTSSRATRGSPG